MEVDEIIKTGPSGRILQVSPARVQQLADQGILPTYLRLSDGTRLFRRSDVLELARTRARARVEQVVIDHEARRAEHAEAEQG